MVPLWLSAQTSEIRHRENISKLNPIRTVLLEGGMPGGFMKWHSLRVHILAKLPPPIKQCDIIADIMDLVYKHV